MLAGIMLSLVAGGIRLIMDYMEFKGIVNVEEA